MPATLTLTAGLFTQLLFGLALARPVAKYVPRIAQAEVVVYIIEVVPHLKQTHTNDAPVLVFVEFGVIDNAFVNRPR